MRDVRLAILGLTAPAFVFLLSSVALANGRFPASNQIVFSTADAHLIVVRTTFGILVSHDGGATLGGLCEEALAGAATVGYSDVGVIPYDCAASPGG